jgi:hypothetical protein
MLLLKAGKTAFTSISRPPHINFRRTPLHFLKPVGRSGIFVLLIAAREVSLQVEREERPVKPTSPAVSTNKQFFKQLNVMLWQM